jgi:type VI secretion system protein ImpC
LWASGSFIAGLLLAETFQQAGWKMQPGSHNEVSGLPVHVYQSGGDSVMTPGAEAWLTTRAVEKISQAGLMPLVSLKNQDKVRLQSFQSLAQGGRPLAGRWT